MVALSGKQTETASARFTATNKFVINDPKQQGACERTEQYRKGIFYGSNQNPRHVKFVA